MGKKTLYLLFGAALWQLSGCGAVEDYLAERVQEEFLVSAGENYQDYQEYEDMKASNRLNEEGMYQEAEEEEETHPGTIHVTFMENSFLKAEYYFDEGLTRQIDTENCYINPGDSIYMSVIDGGAGSPGGYTFSGFRIWEWREDGSRYPRPDIDSGFPLVMTAPLDCRSAQLSVAPLGEYRKKTLSFTDSYINSGGAEIELNGVWKIDNGTETTDINAEISPFITYIISYDYSGYGDEFYFERSDPEPFYISEENSTVQFKKAGGDYGENTEECQSYSVLLHPYIRVQLINNEANLVNSTISAVTGSRNIVRTISVNGESQNVSPKKEQFIEKLRCGDKIQIQVGDGYKAAADGLSADAPRAAVKGGYEYVFTVPQTLETELKIIVDRDTAALGAYRQRSADHGDISVCDASGQPLAPESQAGSVLPWKGFSAKIRPRDEAEITEDMDGTVIRRQDYIQIEEK